jgi:hypothetical protein
MGRTQAAPPAPERAQNGGAIGVVTYIELNERPNPL